MCIKRGVISVLDCARRGRCRPNCFTCFIVHTFLKLNLNGVRRKEPILAIIYNEGCVRILLSV